MWVKKKQLEPDIEQQTIYCDPGYLTCMQSTSTTCEMPDYMNHKLESSLPWDNFNNFRNADDITLMKESEK